MFFSTSSSQQARSSSQKLTPGTQKLRDVAGKIFQKLKPSTGKGFIDLDEQSSAEIQVPRFVTFIRPTEAPQIVDLKAMRQSIRPQLTLINTHQPRVPCSQSGLETPVLHLQISFETIRKPTETGTPLHKNPQQVFTFEATSDRPAAAALDDIVDYEGYEILDEEDSDLDWTLLDLPENVYSRLLSESRHSLI